MADRLTRMGEAPATSSEAAVVSIRLGRGVAVDAGITGGSLLAVGVAVSAILLSTAVIVSAARRPRDAAPPSRRQNGR